MASLLPYQNKSLKNLKGEFWKEVPGLEGYILVSNIGRIKSLLRYVERRNGKGVWLKERMVAQTPKKAFNSYIKDYTFHLTSKIGFEGKVICINVRRLVYEMFVDENLHKKDKRYWVVLVKRGNGLNNKASNLKLAQVGERMRISLQKNRNIHLFYKASPEKFQAGIEKMRQKSFVQIDQYDLAGKFLANYKSIQEAAEKTSVGATNIISCAKKEQITAGGYVWRYAGDSYDGSYARLPRFQIVIMYSLKGKQLSLFANATKAAVASGINRHNIILALKGETKTAGGFIWRFADNPYKGEYGNVQPQGRRAVGRANAKGKIINIFPSLSAASKQTGISVSGIWDRLNNKKKNNEKHTWKYLL